MSIRTAWAEQKGLVMAKAKRERRDMGRGAHGMSATELDIKVGTTSIIPARRRRMRDVAGVALSIVVMLAAYAVIDFVIAALEVM